MREAVHEHVEQQFESPLVARDADAGPGLDDVGYETAAAVKPVPGCDDDQGSTGFEIEAAQQVDRVPTWRRLEHERRIGYDVDRAGRAGCQRRLRETVAHGNRRQRSTGDSCGRPALDVSQRTRTDRMTSDAWIQAFQQGNACRPIGHLGATVVVLEQSAAGNEDAIRGGGGPTQPGDSGRATGDHPGNTANRWARALTGDDRDLGGWVVRHDALTQCRHDGAVTDVVVGVASQQQDPRPNFRHVRQVPRARPSSPGRLEADRCLAGPS